MTQQQFESNEINILKEWSGLNDYDILFDSDIDGNGVGNRLLKVVKNKVNLYFISYDNDNNVFGGFVYERILKKNVLMKDKDTFVFSLIRNGHFTNNRYPISKGNKDYGFTLYSTIYQDSLYSFGYGYDIRGWKVCGKHSYCKQKSYDYSGSKNPLVNGQYPYCFTVQRLIVVQMS